MVEHYNWAGNYRYQAHRLHTPGSLEELAELVTGRPAIRVLGTRHCFNDLADTTGDLVSLRSLPRVVQIDPDRRRVRVDGGISYGELAPRLHQVGYALANLASLPHIGVAGAIATATHGSGNHNRNLAAAVAGLELLTAEGTMIVVDRSDPDFAGYPVHLGALGVITALSLDIEPTFEISTQVFTGLDWEVLLDHLEEITDLGYSFSIAPDWRRGGEAMAFIKRRSGEELPDELFGARAATEPMHPSPGVDPVACTEQLGVPGPWHDRLPHFKLEFEPSTGEELQSEYLVPVVHGRAALQATSALADDLARLAQSTEVRTVAADRLWMSPSYQQDCLAIHFTWVKDQPAVQALLPRLEAVLEPYDARPHWGKLFTISKERLAELFSKLGEFKSLVHRLDPQGVFANDYLRRYGIRSDID